MGEVHSSAASFVHNWTYIENKEAGYPKGAFTIDASLNFPTPFEDATTTALYLSEIFPTIPGAYCSFSFLAKAEYQYLMLPNEGVGTGTVQGPTVIMGDDTIKTVTVLVSGVGVGSNYQMGILTDEPADLVKLNDADDLLLVNDTELFGFSS